MHFSQHSYLQFPQRYTTMYKSKEIGRKILFSCRFMKKWEDGWMERWKNVDFFSTLIVARVKRIWHGDYVFQSTGQLFLSHANWRDTNTAMPLDFLRLENLIYFRFIVWIRAIKWCAASLVKEETVIMKVYARSRRCLSWVSIPMHQICVCSH